MAGKSKRGRYGAVSGCFWRNRKAQALSPAARGLLLNIWSFVADNGTRGVVLAREMKALQAGNPNASRWVKELLDAVMLERRGRDFFVHDYSDWNRLADEFADKNADSFADIDANRDADKNASKNADKSESIKSDVYGAPFKTQDPRPIDTPKPPRGLWEVYDASRRAEYLEALWDAWGAGHPEPGWRDQEALARKLFGWLKPVASESRPGMLRALVAWTRRDFAKADKIRDLLAGDWTGIKPEQAAANSDYPDPRGELDAALRASLAGREVARG